jgi:hypothetical protein
LCGLHGRGAADRVVNVGWQPRFQKYGWYGSHTSCTSEAFVKDVLSAHIVGGPSLDFVVADVSERRARTGPGGPRMTRPPTRPTRSPEPSTGGERIAREAPRPQPRQRRVVAADRVRVPSKPPAPAHADSPVYAPPLGSVLASVAQSPVVRPGQPTTFLTLSCRDPRFPKRSQVADGLRLQLVDVPNGKSAKIEVHPAADQGLAVHDMVVRTGERCLGTNGHSWAVTLLRVDPPSQTAWLQIRPVENAPKRTAKTENKPSPTT